MALTHGGQLDPAGPASQDATTRATGEPRAQWVRSVNDERIALRQGMAAPDAPACLGIHVHDLDRAGGFYRQLGFAGTPTVSSAIADGEVLLQRWEVAGLALELFQLPSSDFGQVPVRSDGPIDHVERDVIDIGATWRAAITAGLQPIESAPVLLRFADHDARYFMVRGPAGEKVEFNQILPGA